MRKPCNTALNNRVVQYNDCIYSNRKRSINTQRTAFNMLTCHQTPIALTATITFSTNIHQGQQICLYSSALPCLKVCVRALCLAALLSNSLDIYSIHSKARGAREQSIGLRSHGN